jgi:aminobenzoyl-glutamate transport protein
MTTLAPAPWFQRLLNRIERIGNALPHPASLFVILSLLVVLASWLCHQLGVSVQNPVTHKVIAVTNLLSVEGLQRIILGLLPNFINFAALGSVLVCLLGLSIAEHSGLLSAVLRLIVHATPRRLLTWIVVFSGAMSHTAGDIGYVLLLPMSAALFLTVGRHPLAGIAAAFAGVSGGFAANLLISPTDVIIAGLTQEAARIINPAYTVTPMANYFFLGASVFLITAVASIVTERIVEPRLGRYQGKVPPEPLVPLSPAEHRGLRWAGAGLLLLVVFVLAGLLPQGGFLQDPAKPGFIGSYFVKGLVFFIFLVGLVPGLAYGIAAGTIRSDRAIYEGMQKNMEVVAGYLVVIFFISQFVNLFNWTNLGVVLAVNGADVLRSLHLGPVPLLIGLVLLTSSIDLMIGSAAGKWAILAPVFVPMFMLLGYSPELTQAAYRVGDSCTNIITPLMSNFALVLMFVQRYEPRAGIGTMTATMLPYTLSFLLSWSLLLVTWVLLGWPVGPGAPLFLSSP